MLTSTQIAQLTSILGTPTITLLAAAPAFFKITSRNTKIIFGVITSITTIIILVNFYSAIEEFSSTTKKNIEYVEARKTILFRISTRIEDIKYAFQWKIRNPFSGEISNKVDDEKYSSVFLNPQKQQLDNIKELVIKPVYYSVEELEILLKSHRNLMKFEEADSIQHFLDTMRGVQFLKTISNYEEREIDNFSEYLKKNELYYSRLKYLLLSLAGLENINLKSKEENNDEFLKLRPECRSPSDPLSCI